MAIVIAGDTPLRTRAEVLLAGDSESESLMPVLVLRDELARSMMVIWKLSLGWLPQLQKICHHRADGCHCCRYV